ncbi:MAG: histidine kinase [Bacteroidota bacterium]
MKYQKGLGFLSRLAVSTIVATILIAIIWVCSLFKEPPGWHPIVILLLAFMHLTFELVRWLFQRIFSSGFSRTNTLKVFWGCLLIIAIGSVFYSLLFYIFKWIDHLWLNSEPPAWSHMQIAFLVGLILNIIFTLIQLAWQLNQAYYQKVIDNERFKTEITEANLAVLTHQLDPHFLFNNFNTLYYLIDEDQTLAKRFLKNLSSIYRHLLQRKDENQIPALEEYKIAQQYWSILQERYAEALQVDNQIDTQHLHEKQLPPLVLQQLLENAVKHNQIDPQQPLYIKLHSTYQAITVVNKRNPKTPTTSTGIGIPNLMARYGHLTDEEVIISETNNQYSVTIPLL